jgi:CHAD domain-containing protein
MTMTEEQVAADEAASGRVENIVPLDAGMPAITALKRIHLELLRRIEANEDGVLGLVPGESLHDFRVAVRRTRTGLRQLEQVYPHAVGARFADDFKWLSGLTSTARDLQVYRRAFEVFPAALGADTVADLAPFREFLRAHERDERQRCTSALASSRYQGLKDDWRRFLQGNGSCEEHPDGPDAARPVRAVAAQSIRAAYDRVVRRSPGLQADSPARTFHRMRLDCKKLRYLLEFFGNLFDGQEGLQIIRSLRRTQDALGAINDLRVQADWLARYDVDAAAPRALAEHLQQRQACERQAFLARFTEFIGADTAAGLDRFLDSCATAQ